MKHIPILTMGRCSIAEDGGEGGGLALAGVGLDERLVSAKFLAAEEQFEKGFFDAI